MKNLYVVVLSFVIVCSGQSIHAQIAKAGMLDASFGIGVLPTFNKDNGDVKLLPLSIGFDYQLSPHFRLGLLYGHSITQAEDMFLDAQKVRWENSFSTVSLRVIVNGGKWKNWDVYGGFSINYNQSDITVLEGNDPTLLNTIGLDDETSFTYTGLIGAQYVISKKWRAFGELGYNVSLATLGVKFQIR